MRSGFLLLLLVGCSPGSPSANYLPDKSRTPGAINHTVTQENLTATVCAAGWTKTIRPRGSYMEKLKKRQMLESKLPGTPRDYHENYRIPLCAGGHPTDPHNLWPQPVSGEWTDKAKERLERSVCHQLCTGDITLKEAQAIFREPDWTKVYERYFRTK
jgi:hypothetical protein